MRHITITDAVRAQILKDFAATLTNSRNLGDFTYKYSAETLKPADTIHVDFSSIAWLKMSSLINNSNLEIGWQGIVRANTERTIFRIEDILLYPQKTTSVTVQTDEEEYENWHQSLEDDEYNNLRFQGHSHVHMPTNPSAVDLNLYDSMLQTLSPTSYYIFMIMNKNNAYWINIYDLPNNSIYETQDVTVSIEGLNLKNWYDANVKVFIKSNISPALNALGQQSSTPYYGTFGDRKSNGDDPTHNYVSRGHVFSDDYEDSGYLQGGGYPDYHSKKDKKQNKKGEVKDNGSKKTN